MTRNYSPAIQAKIDLGKQNERRIMEYIEWYLGTYPGTSPSIRQIHNSLGYNDLGSVLKHVHTLRDKGYIIYEASHGKRSVIRLTAKRYPFDA